MGKRRGNNEGSIYQRPDGRWCAQVSIGGRRLTKYAATQRECRERLKETIAQVDNGLTFNGARTDLATYFGEWLDIIKPTVHIRTWQQYSHVAQRHLMPSLGRIKLNDLRPDQIQAVYTSKLEAGIGAHTVRLMHAILHRCLNQALKWGLISRNPADAVDKPKQRRLEIVALDLAQTKKLLTVAEGDRLEALFRLAVHTGLREGELLGLRWSDLDPNTGALQVQRQLQRISGQGIVFADTKTATGRRQVVLGPAMLKQLREHGKRQKEERLFTGERWCDQGLMFTTTIGTPMDPANVLKHFKELLAKAELPDIRFHDLRHTAASLMLQQGVHPKVVQERLGHSTVSLTLDVYSHVVPSLQRDAADIMDAALDGGHPQLQ
jgi:integrase